MEFVTATDNGALLEKWSNWDEILKITTKMYDILGENKYVGWATKAQGCEENAGICF